MRRTARRSAGGALLLCVLALPVGCVSKWTLRTSEPARALQWPYPPGAPKVTYLRSLSGLTKKKGSTSLLRAFAFGSESDDRDAFVLPVAVATGGDGRIAVADMGRKCVHLYIPGEQRYLRLSGSAPASIVSPVGVVFDGELRLYLSDSTGSVFAFGADGAVLFRLQRAGVDPLLRPTGLAWSPVTRLLYVVDTLAHRVHAFRRDGELAFSFGRRGDEKGAFNFPTHIFRSSAGELYVTDALNFRIEIFDESGAPVGSFGHHGDGSGDLAMPKGLAVDGDGIVYVVDSAFDNVQLFDREGRFLLTLGKRGVDFGEFWLPSGVFISEAGELYVCDTYNRRIQVFRITGRYGEHASS